MQEWQTLTRDQGALVHRQMQLVNQLTACRKEYDPAALGLFANLHQCSTLVVLPTSPTPLEAQAASLEQITATLHQGNHPNPTTAAQEILEDLHRPHLVANAVTVRAKARLMVALTKHLLVLVEEIARDEKEIQALFLTHKDHDLWTSLPGAGRRLTPRLLAEWGEDRGRSLNATSVHMLAGTAPAPSESGTDANAHTRFACVKPLCNALQPFAWQSTKQEPWALAYSQRKRAEGKTRRMALRALAPVWVRIIYRMWPTQTPLSAHPLTLPDRLMLAVPPDNF